MAKLSGSLQSLRRRWRGCAGGNRLAVLCCALWIAVACTAQAAEPFPLEPPDTSSPRATLFSYLENNALGIARYRQDQSKQSVLAAFARAQRCLDLSEVPPDLGEFGAVEASLLLYEILNRAGVPDPDQVPDAGAVEEGELRTWTVPRTSISIVRVEEGERAGEFLFSPRSAREARKFYAQVEHLPHATDYPPGNYEDFVTRPSIGLPYAWTSRLPAWATARIARNPVWKWLAVALAIAAGALVALAAHRASPRATDPDREPGMRWRIGKVAFAATLTLIPMAVAFAVRDVIGLRFEAHAIVSRALLVLTFAAGVYATFAVVGLVAEIVISSRRLRERSLNAHLIRVTSRLVSVVASAALLLEAAEMLGLALGPVLAGLGIGGLAVALAARPTLENIIGGYTLFADRPVRVGDYCRFGAEEGTIEEIGVRSTRVRKRDDTVVSIPNADFSQRELQNNNRRRRWLSRTTRGLRFETTPEQLRFVLARLRELLVGHPKVYADPLFVRFEGFGEYSLDVELFAYIRTREWLSFMAVREDINLRIMDLVSEAGTGFAFPSRTAYLARDGGLDAERTGQAEAAVGRWRREGRLPFPEPAAAQREALADRLDYPPTGSPDHEPRSSRDDAGRETGRETMERG